MTSMLAKSTLQLLLKNKSETLVCARNISKIIVIKGLPKRISEAEVNNLIKPFGVVEKLSLLDNKRTNNSLTGIVVFKDIDSAIKALDHLNETNIFGRPRSIVFGAADRSTKRSTSTNPHHKKESAGEEKSEEQAAL